MADHIHMALASFREEILTSTARLEFQLRDMNQRITAQINNPNAVRGCARNEKFWAEDTDSDVISVQRHDELENRIRVLEATIQTLLENQQKVASTKDSSVTTTIEHDLLSMQAPENTRNIIVKSHCGTPALAAAVAAANAPRPPELVLPVVADAVGVVADAEEVVAEEATVVEEEEDTNEGVGEAAAEDTHEVVEEADEEDEEDEEDDGPTLTRMVLNNQVYFLDEENTAYQETEDGYEEVGVFNPVTKRVEVVVDEEEGAEEEEDAAEEEEQQEDEQEEEEGIEVEEFLYKGKTYARDAENNVYLDGEQIGTWNGKKIVPLT